MAIGGFRFSWQGAVIGFFVGYCIEEVLKGNFSLSPEKTFKKNENVSFSQHQIRLLILVAAILNTERKIHSKKLRYATKYFYRQFGTVYGDEMRIQLIDFLKKNYNFIPVAEDIKHAFNHQGKISILNFLYGLSVEDGDLTIRETNLLKSMAHHMGLSQQDFERIVYGYKKSKEKDNSFFKYSSLDYAYRSLGIDKSSSDAELKKTYRKLVLKYHPDRTTLELDEATKKFDEITKAYEKIKAARNIK